MKKTSVLLLVLFSVASTSSLLHAQTSIGILIGPSVPNLSGGSNEITQGYVSRLALHFGISIEHDLIGGFLIQPGIIFDEQGGQRNGLQPITSTSLPPLASGGYYYADFKNASILNYIEVPVLVGYKFGGRPIGFKINAGPYIGYLTSASQKTSGTSLIYVDKNRTPLTIPIPPDYTQSVQAPPESFDANTDVTDSIHRINVGVEGGIGVDMPLTTFQTVSLEVHGLYGLTNIQKYSEDGTNHTGNLLISLGYSLQLPGIL
ncbi:MAG: porin family protein [Bacteroidota bacterium]